MNVSQSATLHVKVDLPQSTLYVRLHCGNELSLVLLWMDTESPYPNVNYYIESKPQPSTNAGGCGLELVRGPTVSFELWHCARRRRSGYYE